MDVHKNAPLTPKGREAMVRGVMEDGLSKAAAARQFNITPKIVAKWVERFRAKGVERGGVLGPLRCCRHRYLSARWPTHCSRSNCRTIQSIFCDRASAERHGGVLFRFLSEARPPSAGPRPPLLNGSGIS